ncbi:MAG: HD domain-containing protein [Tenericutes bacterium]|jgi:putative nucleotidyltransferase with HDIG domain|nr:HD domain-containing protein [Mycoplasmatota bacterium]
MDNIKKTIKFLQDEFYRTNNKYYKENPHQREYRLNHTYRVASIGKEIAIKEDLNVKAAIIGCLLHDISYIEPFNAKEDWLNHGRNAAKIAREYLKTISMDESLKQEIIYGIAIHVDDMADFDGERTILAETIGEADNIDRLGKYRMYEALKNSDLDKMTLKEKLVFIEERILNLKKLKLTQHKTKTSNDLWQANLDDQINYYQALNNQLKNSYEDVLMDE